MPVTDSAGLTYILPFSQRLGNTILPRDYLSVGGSKRMYSHGQNKTYILPCQHVALPAGKDSWKYDNNRDYPHTTDHAAIMRSTPYNQK
jgi:hypothetical protein